MILDSSAVVAILVGELDQDRLLARARVESLAIGAPTLVETGLVLTSRLETLGRTLLSRFLDELDVEVISFGAAHWPVALDAFARFGKGRHPAGLNLGDCLTYAVARLADEPLLCLSGDFARTDLALA